MNSYKLIVYQLTRPVSYLFIKHADKYIYDWVVPFVLLVVSAILMIIFSASVFEIYLLVEKVADFLGSLPGFFIAALAAIATFNRLDIDKPMAGKNPPKVETLVNTQYLEVELSRRRFLCMLFSFLTMQSIILSVFGFLPEVFGFYSKDNMVMNISAFASISFLLIYFFFAFQLLAATMHGMYYLGDRIHY
ncbi:hypothetical protein JNO04_05235 [Halomonas sp. MC140]|nr:hypothetical protein [Halomonas sp. MC140]MDN7131758.1 hypothetical protein [Halomonas sp. MC140]